MILADVLIEKGDFNAAKILVHSGIPRLSSISRTESFLCCWTVVGNLLLFAQTPRV